MKHKQNTDSGMPVAAADRLSYKYQTKTNKYDKQRQYSFFA